MPTITLNKKSVFKYVGKNITDLELKEAIPMLGASLEDMSKDEFVVEVAPNRPDLLSEAGMARALSSYLEIHTGLKHYEILSSKNKDEKVIIEPSVKKVRPYTACAIIRNLKLDDSKIKEIIQIQEKLHITFGRNRKKAAIGIYPLEKIKLPIYFKALSPDEIKFRPLESDKIMSGNEILSIHPKGKEYAHLLEGNSLYPIFVDSDNNILSMPPVINSHNTGKVTEKTTEVFIECSGFDLNVLKKCLNMIVSAFSDLGGKIYSMELVYPDKKEITPNLEPDKMPLDLKYVKKLLGTELTEKDAVKCLHKMGFGFEKNQVLVPAYRTDVMHQCDLAEDIGIAYGYDNILPVIPKVSTIAKEDSLELFKKRICIILSGLGLIETKSYNLTSRDSQQNKMMLSEKELSLVELANALTVDYNMLRSWIIPCLLETYKFNKINEFPQNIFDMGRIFNLHKSSENITDCGIIEEESLAVGICDKSSDFTKIKQILDLIFSAIDLKYDIKELEQNYFISGRCAVISVNKKQVGIIGEIHPQVLINFEIDMPVSVLELNLSKLFNIFNELKN